MKANLLLRGAGLLLVAAVAWGGLFPIALDHVVDASIRFT